MFFSSSGFYSNKSRGLRAKAEQERKITDTVEGKNEVDINIIEQRELAHELIHLDVSQYQPKNVPSLTWCECIKKIWRDDPLICP